MDAIYDTLPPGAISEELAPVIQSLGLTRHCEELVTNGWTVIEGMATADFNDRLRQAIKEHSASGGANMLLHKDSVFVEAVLQPALRAMAEFSVGRGHLLSQVAASVRGKGAPSIGLHADHNWLPAPFPAHNMLLTACWTLDDYTEAGGATLIIPGSNASRRHPNGDEIRALKGAQPIECPACSVALWDGNI